ncbi:cilia- and flagella-associated protein 68 isoform X4 [Vulpes vulpes]|uniref:Cilia- and flagella-associated protein 68 isoform X4 n=1 Tax=Vulpes vulpes TaxID=9627 RepID=A0A3Q7TMU7_VULVU
MAASLCLCCSRFLQRQSLAYFLANPHYGSLINADGHAEIWTDWNDMSKFFQYGWRCTTNENSYSNHTLMGNWNQERYDLRNIVQPKPLPSQDLRESLTGFQDISLSWILLDTNAQKSQLIWLATQNLHLGITLPVCGILVTANRSRILRKNKKLHFSRVNCRREHILSTSKNLADYNTVSLSE